MKNSLDDETYMALAHRWADKGYGEGGCPIGGSSSDGVVNANGQVFNTMAGSQTVHPGLYVVDGSIIPGPLAVNPTLTIVSTALRIAASIP